MSKLNYAKIRQNQKKIDTNYSDKNTIDTPSPLDVRSSTSPCLPSSDTITSNVPPKIESAKLANLFGENVLMDNLDYINSLLQTQFTDCLPHQPSRKKNKQKIEVDPPQQQVKSPEKGSSPSKPSNNNNTTMNVPLNSPGMEPGSPITNPYEIGQNPHLRDIPVNPGEIPMGLTAAKNMSNIVARKDAEMYQEYFQNDFNDGGKRSMSMGDVRISKRDFSKPSSIFKTTNLPSTGEEMITGEEQQTAQATLDLSPTVDVVEHDRRNSKAQKSDFCSSLNQYIGYFQRSETNEYKITKANQYMAGNMLNSNKGSNSDGQLSLQQQQQGQSSRNEIESLKNQVKKLKGKMKDLQLTNELLANERKSWRKREQELLARAELAEAEKEKAQKKKRKYKEKLTFTQEMLQREKMENESNMLALRRVLANNISTVLEHKIQTYQNEDYERPHKEKQLEMISPDKNIGKGKTSGSHKDKDQRKNTITSTNTVTTYSDQAAIITRQNMYEENTNGVVKNKWKYTSIKEKTSPLLSQKEQSCCSDDENTRVPERLTTVSKSDEIFEEEFVIENRKPSGCSRKSGFETSSELTEEFFIHSYDKRRESERKLQQIQSLQAQLSKLMQKEDNGLTSQYTKSSRQKNTSQMKNSKMKLHPFSYYN